MSDNTERNVPNNQRRKEVDPHLAQPVEVAARRSDAAVAEHGMSKGDELLNIYRLEPIAAPDDPRWDNAPGHGVVTVAARSSGDARLVAASQELDYMEIDAKPAEDVTTGMASAFRSEKLYTVIEIARDRQGLTRGLIEGEIGVDTIRPVQI
jgi:hypothetical protein